MSTLRNYERSVSTTQFDIEERKLSEAKFHADWKNERKYH